MRFAGGGRGGGPGCGAARRRIAWRLNPGPGSACVDTGACATGDIGALRARKGAVAPRSGLGSLPDGGQVGFRGLFATASHQSLKTSGIMAPLKQSSTLQRLLGRDLSLRCQRKVMLFEAAEQAVLFHARHSTAFQRQTPIRSNRLIPPIRMPGGPRPVFDSGRPANIKNYLFGQFRLSWPCAPHTLH